MVVSVLVVYPDDHGADWELIGSCGSYLAQHHEVVPHLANPGRCQNSKFEVWSLPNEQCFYTTIKQKRSNYHKSGAICIPHKGI